MTHDDDGCPKLDMSDLDMAILVNLAHSATLLHVAGLDVDASVELACDLAEKVATEHLRRSNLRLAEYHAATRARAKGGSAS